MMRLRGMLRAAALAIPLSLAGAAASGAVDLVEAAERDGRFGVLVRALKASGMAHRLRTPGPFTLFAPTDAAFAAIPRDELKAILAGDRERLRALLRQHVVEGRRPSAALPAELAPLAGAPLGVAYRGGRLAVAGGGGRGGAVVDGDIEADNGLIHAIDSVLVPPVLATPPERFAPVEPRVALGRPDGPVAVEVATGETGAQRVRARAFAPGEPAGGGAVGRGPGDGGWIEAAAASPPGPAGVDDLIGRAVRTGGDEGTGVVAEFVPAHAAGAVEAIVVEFGPRAVTVPWDAVRIDEATGQLVVDAAPPEVEAAAAGLDAGR